MKRWIASFGRDGVYCIVSVRAATWFLARAEVMRRCGLEPGEVSLAEGGPEPLPGFDGCDDLLLLQAGHLSAGPLTRAVPAGALLSVESPWASALRGSRKKKLPKKKAKR